MRNRTGRKIPVPLQPPSEQSWKKPRKAYTSQLKPNAMVDCGWGRLLFGHTFESQKHLAETLISESKGRRDVALYLRDPHVLLNIAPHELFLDPSHTYRIRFERYRPSKSRPKGFSIRRMRDESDLRAINRIYKKRQMVPLSTKTIKEDARSKTKTWLVVQESKSKKIIGTVLGVDHLRAFNDPERGSSLWSLAVDPATNCVGIGEALVRYLIEHYQARERAYLDLSVMHNNDQAIALYEKLGFKRVPVFCVKHKNAINEPLFIAPEPAGKEKLNPYAKIIADEARRRGILVDVIDAKRSYFNLSFGGREVRCRESLTDLTSSLAYLYCSDKVVTRQLLKKANIRVPEQREITKEQDLKDFFREHKQIVVKPADSEQGQGVYVDLRNFKAAKDAWLKVKEISARPIAEEYLEGQDLRLVVIDYKLVAASLRLPPRILGTGQHTIKKLIEKRNRRTMAATGGESKIPLDEETERCVRHAGYEMTDILDEGEELEVRKTANLHTGGSMWDVTDRLHPSLAQAAEDAARVLQIPVVGLDFVIQSVEEPSYAVIEANERPGLANHEPQPTAERFIDLLFPQTKV